MNSIMRLILWGKGISLSAEKVPKSLRNMACFINRKIKSQQAELWEFQQCAHAPGWEEETGHMLETASSTSKSTRGVCWTSPPVSGRTAIRRERNSCCGPNPQVFLLADLSQKSKDQRAAPTSASAAPGMRGGEAHICCLNTDREHVGPWAQCTAHGSQVSAGCAAQPSPPQRPNSSLRQTLDLYQEKALCNVRLMFKIISRRCVHRIKIISRFFT